MTTYSELKKIEEAKKELKAALKKVIELRKEKKNLEDRLKKVKETLAKRDQVETLIESAKFRGLEILKDRAFIAAVEEEVAAETKRKRKSSSARRGGSVRRVRLSVDEKKALVREFVSGCKGGNPKVAELGAWLETRGIVTSAGSFLKSLKLEDDALRSLGAKRDGTEIVLSKIAWLA